MLVRDKLISALPQPGTGISVNYQRTLQEGIRLLGLGYKRFSEGDVATALMSLSDGVDLLGTIKKPSGYTQATLRNQAMFGIAAPPFDPGCSQVYTTAQINIRRAEAKIKQIGDLPEPAPLPTEGAIEIVVEPGASVLQARDLIKKGDPETKKPAPSKRLKEPEPDIPDTTLDDEANLIELSRNPEPEVVLLIMSFTEDHLVLDKLGLDLLLAVACNDNLKDDLSLENIEYNKISPTAEINERLLRACIYGGYIANHNISAVCGGLTRYLSRHLSETLKDWYLKCSEVENPDYIDQYLFGSSRVESRESKFTEIKNATELFLKKAKNDDVLNDAEFNLLLSVINLAADKKSLTRIKRELGGRDEVKRKLNTLILKLERYYGLLPHRIKMGPLAKHLKERKSSTVQERLEMPGIINISSWLGVPKTVVTSYLATKEVCSEN